MWDSRPHLREAWSSACVIWCSRCMRACRCSSQPALYVVLLSSSAVYEVCLRASDHVTEPLKEHNMSADQLVCRPTSLSCKMVWQYIHVSLWSTLCYIKRPQIVFDVNICAI